MKRFSTQYLCIIILGITLISCSRVISGLYGIKKVGFIDEHEILKYGQKYDIPVQDIYFLDSTYHSYLSNLDSVKYKTQIKNHYQPLQVLYYDNSGILLSFYVNCYAGGFPNLNWNKKNNFDIFLPSQQAPVDNIISLSTQLKYLKPLSNTKEFSIENYNYIVVVYWSKFMGRQSKRLISLVQKNAELAGEKKVKIVYVNNDNLFLVKE